MIQFLTEVSNLTFLMLLFYKLFWRTNGLKNDQYIIADVKRISLASCYSPHKCFLCYWNSACFPKWWFFKTGEGSNTVQVYSAFATRVHWAQVELFFHQVTVKSVFSLQKFSSWAVQNIDESGVSTTRSAVSLPSVCLYMYMHVVCKHEGNKQWPGW